MLVGADGTPEAQPVIEFAFDQASLRGVPLTVAHRLWDVVAAVSGIRDEGAIDPSRGEQEKSRLLLEESVACGAASYPDVHVRLHDAVGLAEEIAASVAVDWDVLVVPRHAVGAREPLPSATLATTLLDHGPTTVALVPEAPALFDEL